MQEASCPRDLQSLENGTALHPIPIRIAQGLDEERVKLGSQGLMYVLLSDSTGISNAEREMSSPASGQMEILTPLRTAHEHQGADDPGLCEKLTGWSSATT